jgi:hypothetical protein
LNAFLERNLGVPKEQLQAVPKDPSQAAIASQAIAANTAIMRARIEQAQQQTGAPPGEKGVLDSALYDYLKQHPLPRVPGG